MNTTADVKSHCTADCTTMMQHNDYASPKDYTLCKRVIASCDAEGVVGYIFGGQQKGQCITEQTISAGQLHKVKPTECCAATPQQCKHSR